MVIDRRVQPNARVTVKLDRSTRHQKGALPSLASFAFACAASLTRHAHARRAVLKGAAVAPSEPKEQLGLYWGYTTRLACGLGAVLDECPYEVGRLPSRH